jgi:hypothetical protein
MRYFVSYAYAGETSGFGNIDINAKKKIQTIVDIRGVEDAIKDAAVNNGQKVEAIRIISFQVLSNK